MSAADTYGPPSVPVHPQMWVTTPSSVRDGQSRGRPNMPPSGSPVMGPPQGTLATINPQTDTSRSTRSQPPTSTGRMPQDTSPAARNMPYVWRDGDEWAVRFKRSVCSKPPAPASAC